MRTTFTSKWATTGLDMISEPENLIASDERMNWIRDGDETSYSDRFDLIKQMRQADEDLATITNHGRVMGGTGEYKRVASIPQSVMVAAMVLEPDLLLNKKKFYSWLDRHPEYCTYNRTRGAR